MAFTDILNLSISASWLVLAIVLLRLVLRKAPKAFHCALWALVAIRLLCPISIESALSLIPSREVVPREYLAAEPREPGYWEPARLEIVTNPAYDTGVTIELDTTVDRVQNWDLAASILWVAGIGAMGIYAAYSYLSLRLRVRMAGWSGGNIYECDELDSPFILGILRPRIYLPSELDEVTRSHVLAHENAHLKRLDHLWKPLGFCLLAVHWFNPVIWLGYALLCRDIELACDERVIKKLDKPQVRAYSEALVRCTVTHRSIAMCPLAFGEVGVKSRIRAMLHYKKPGFWLLLAAIAAAVTLAVCFLTDPAEPNTPDITPTDPPLSTNGSSVTERTIGSILNEDGCAVTQTVQRDLDVMFYIDWLPEECFSNDGYTFREGELTLLETDTTVLEFARVIPEGNCLRFDCRFRYSLPESGTILLPCHVNIKGVTYNMRLTGDFHDYIRDYDDGVELLQQKDTMEFSLLIDRDLVENANDYLSVGLGQLWETTYVPNDLSIQDKQLHVEEVLYRDERYTLSGSAAYAPTYIVGWDLHLTALEQCSRWEVRRDLGDLTVMELTRDNFDALFLENYLVNGFSPAKLREGNARTWLCTEQEQTTLQMQQTDGTLYLAVIRKEGNLPTDLYRLRIGDMAERAPEVVRHSFALADSDVFDKPHFTLHTDGTFTLTTSMLSSYLGYGRYVLEEDSLVMKTSDGRCTWTFIPEGTGFRYDAAHSTEIAYYKGAKEFFPLPDGARFRGDSPYSGAALPLEEAVSEAIIGHNWASEDEGLICVENHEVLGELVACGINTIDNSSPIEILKLYLAGEYKTYSMKLSSQRSERFCATVTLELGADGYTVTAYEQTDFKAKEAEAIFPEHILEALKERSQIINSWASRENVFDARLVKFRSMGLETDIGALLDTICSSPSAASNPGAYIDIHPEEYERLVSLGSHTIRYCFTQFAKGDQMDLRGHIMALACQEIIGDHVAESEYGTCMTGQAWFNHFAAIAEEHRSQERLIEFERSHPWCFLALSILGI